LIDIILKGRLGNWLFQYAVARRLALKHDTYVRFNLRSLANRHDVFGRKIITQLRSFNIQPFHCAPMLHRRLGRRFGVPLAPPGEKLFCAEFSSFIPEVLELGDHVALDGYFQSLRYLEGIEEVIREDFKPASFVYPREAMAIKAEIEQTNAVSMHVRRGDYLTCDLMEVCTEEYFRRAIEHMAEHLDSPRFFIFSDDIEWCRKNIVTPSGRFVEIKTTRWNPLADFNLMRLCRHHIISNSTFSWWPAYLNNCPGKMVVAPSRWNIPEDLNNQTMENIIPADWITIDP
jgi:hypothetical protein